jgi:hypothetical protein
MRKKVTKKTPKATKMETVKAMKHKRVILEAVGTPTIPDMVSIVSGPAWAKSLIGRRFVTMEAAVVQIEALDVEKAISRGAKSILKEMDANGIVPLDMENL